MGEHLDNRIIRRMYWVLLFVLFVLTDYGIKWGVRTAEVPILCNPGIAFSIMLPSVVLLVLSLSILLIVAVLWWRSLGHSWVQTLAFTLILGGGVGNAIDRITVGCVTDYIPFFGLFSFNLADAFITSGVMLLLWQAYRDD